MVHLGVKEARLLWQHLASHFKDIEVVIDDTYRSILLKHIHESQTR